MPARGPSLQIRPSPSAPADLAAAAPLELRAWSRSRRELTLRFGVNGRPVVKRYRYADVDLIGLEARYGRENLERLYFHIMAFEAIPLSGGRPHSFSLGPLARFHTRAFAALWRAVFRNAGAQWRYENGLAAYDGPRFEEPPRSGPPAPVEVAPGPVPVLSFNGGGKDSLAAMKLLERAGVPFSSFSYSHPSYGAAAPQHALLDALADAASIRLRHRLEIEDGDGGPRSSLCAETPAAVMAALPVALEHGYRFLAIGHERSADAPNLYWESAGQAVNHQWAKSLEAELLLARYIRAELASNLSYFSVLKPIHDVVIFNLLEADLDSLARAHSCNVRKPWCLRCPKCAYVWLSYNAWLPAARVRAIFPQNLFEVPGNVPWFRQLLGLESHKPFECVGEIGEARLAFALCLRRGLRGAAVDACAAALPPLEFGSAGDRRYFTVHRSPAVIPPQIARGVFPQMERAAARARLLAELAWKPC